MESRDDPPLVWLRKHGQMNWHKLGGSDLKRKVMESEKRPQTPEQRIKELEQELKEANLKAQLFIHAGHHQDRIWSQTAKKAFRLALERQKAVRISIAQACRFVGISR